MKSNIFELDFGLNGIWYNEIGFVFDREGRSEILSEWY